jgi:hypothetical protein
MPAQLLRTKPSVAVKLLVFFITTNSAALIYQKSIRPFEPFGGTPKIIFCRSLVGQTLVDRRSVRSRFNPYRPINIL